ncbi:hypothetical protein JVT61DRAFT_13768 [Boletus reticuloceps]|uniref:Uncharacterized protein n=1 Tax=Boletus reticuloceps TaxID=495285 RepID=A0A8I2YT35_9AGAM|nr:hypothetical protein JVT61DRAFT_13768 [Boletus reticuloceps]
MGKVHTVEFNADAREQGRTIRRLGCGIYGTSQSRAPIQVLEEARDAVQALHVGPMTILAGSVDGYVRTYDLRKGASRRLCRAAGHVGRAVCRRDDAPGGDTRLAREAV